MKNQNFAKRLGFAWSGIKSAIQNEKSFRTQVIITILVILSLGILGANPVWWALILICIGMVLSAELMNTALEAFIDRIHPDIHPAVGLAKDCAAGAVWVSSMIAALVYGFYLIDRFPSWFTF